MINSSLTTLLFTGIGKAQTGSTASSSAWLNIGYFFLQDIMKDRSRKDIFRDKTAGRKITFDCYTIHRFLTYARILDPLSKFATWYKLDTYYEKPAFDYQHILRFMDVLEGNYDCTNFYFEREQLTAIPLEQEVLKMLSGAKFIYCADAGLGSYNIRKSLRSALQLMATFYNIRPGFVQYLLSISGYKFNL